MVFDHDVSPLDEDPHSILLQMSTDTEGKVLVKQSRSVSRRGQINETVTLMGSALGNVAVIDCHVKTLYKLNDDGDKGI